MNPEIGFSGFRDRLAQLIDGKEPFVWAKRVGIPSSTFDRIWNGGAVPKADTLLRIARYAGVTVDWLLTGEGPMQQVSDEAASVATREMKAAARPTAAPEPSAGRLEIDAELHGRVVDGIAKVYKEEGVRLPDIDLGRLAARVYGDVVNAGPGSWEEKMVGLRVALEQIRRELRAAPGVPAETKRSA